MKNTTASTLEGCTAINSIRDRIHEHVEFLNAGFPEGITLATWIDDADRFETLEATNPESLQVESMAYSWGYLQGAADIADRTVAALLADVGVVL